MTKVEHLLACLAEECAEVQQSIMKALRFGLDDGYPVSETTNAQDISKEFCEAIAVLELLEEMGALKKTTVLKTIKEKKERVRHYMEYAVVRGALSLPQEDENGS